MCPIVRERSHSARFARRASIGALRYAGEKEDDRRKTIFPLQRTAVPKWNRRCQFLGTCSDGRPACKAVNFRCGSTTEVSDGHENVRSWVTSGSRIWAAGGLLVARSGRKANPSLGPPGHGSQQSMRRCACRARPVAQPKQVSSF